MGYLVIAHDQAPRTTPVLQRHGMHVRAAAAEGVVAVAGPILGPDGQAAGSVLFLEGDRAALDAYLDGEPFLAEGVWAAQNNYPFRIAPLAYRPLPGQEGGPEKGFAATLVVALDGHDAEAGARRLAVRPTHFARVAPEAASGRLVVGGAMLDEAGQMRGSALILALSEAEARDWVAADPYVQGDVWQKVSFHPVFLAALPYRGLPAG
jgi:uncharacterized protein YciI